MGTFPFPFPSLLCLSALLVLTFNGQIMAIFAQMEDVEQKLLWRELQSQQQHRIKRRTDCRLDKITAHEPVLHYDFEAGDSEIWNLLNKQFACAGVAVVRNVIQPRGLFLPHYNGATQLFYILQGSGLQGTIIPGCPETYDTNVQICSDDPRRSFSDRHQKIRQFKKGDIFVFPAGVTLWYYNDGDTLAIALSLLDIGSEANQLDQTFRVFFLAGNPRISPGKQLERVTNVFKGFGNEMLKNSLDVNANLSRRLKGEGDDRGRIVLAEKFEVVTSGEGEDECISNVGEEVRNGLGSTLCTMSLKENLADPTRADIYTERAGYINIVNSQKLPILNWLQLSAERGFLEKKAILAPHWSVNAHTIIYIIRGSSRIQVVGDTGKLLFDGEVHPGQVVIVPMNFVYVKKAGDEGCEWIAFKTHGNAMTSTLAGRLSAIRAMPVEVLMNSYGITRDEGWSLKYNREEFYVLSGKV